MQLVLIFSVSGFPKRMLEVELSGVAEALGNLTELGAIDPVVKATVSLSQSGFVSVAEAIATGEIKDDSIAGMYRTVCARNFNSCFSR